MMPDPREGTRRRRRRNTKQRTTRTNVKRRNKNYRIPFVKDPKTGETRFPTMLVLFNFIRRVLMDLVHETKEENIFDSQVARFIYPGYPYAHQFKQGNKNISNVIELTLLARNLGVPFAWIQRIRKGEWDLKQALAVYEERKQGRALAAEAEHTGPLGRFHVTIRTEEHDAHLLGDLYAASIHELRPVVSKTRRGRPILEYV